MNAQVRTTLVVQEWAGDGIVETDAANVMLVDSLAAARFAIRTQALEMSLDIGRVVVDSAVTALECLHFIASLPGEFAGDVLFILDREHAFLSASGRGGDRVLYALSESDVAFYLAAHGRLRAEGPSRVRLSA
ncbi:MAG: hypothetical protein WA208_15490 [Thermoanaerobaculia bacterium]